MGISYLYCDYTNPKQTVAVLLGSLTRRLLHCRASITTYVETLYKLQIKHGLRPSTDEYVSLLQQISEGIPKVFIIVDALDEYKEIDAMKTKFLEYLQIVSPVKTRILITSRRLKDIEQDLLDAPELEIRASDEDISNYADSQIDNSRRLRLHAKKEPGLRRSICTRMIEKCDGMFLLARLHMNTLVHSHHFKDVKSTLGNISKDIDNT